MKTNPARIPSCSWASPSRSSANRPCTVTTSTADRTKDSAFAANTRPAPITASRTPPIAGPIMIPAFAPTWISPLAHARSSSSTRFGIAAAEADQKGVSTMAAANPTASNQPGSWLKAIAAKHAAPARSDTIMTRLRSNRSPSTPPIGANRPLTPNVSRSDADNQAAERVCSKTV